MLTTTLYIASSLNTSTAGGCQCLAVGCLIEDKTFKLNKGHNSEKKNAF